MDRLNELVNGSPSLQRLRDVACQLMLPNRQQEELANYVNAFINNFFFFGGIRYWQNWSTGAYKWLDWREFGQVQPSIKPYIKQVFVSQGCYSSIEAQPSANGVIVSPNRGFAIIDFVKKFPDGIPANAYWFGFVSPVFSRGNVRTSETGTDLEYFSKALTPYTVATGVGAWDAPCEFRKLTDTSPLVSKDGLVYVDFSEGMKVPQKFLALEPTFRVSFNYVGMIVIFGGVVSASAAELEPEPEPEPEPVGPRSLDELVNFLDNGGSTDDLTTEEKNILFNALRDGVVHLPDDFPVAQH